MAAVLFQDPQRISHFQISGELSVSNSANAPVTNNFLAMNQTTSLDDDCHSRHLLALRLAREAGDLILRYCRHSSASADAPGLSICSKSDVADLVTAADLASQEHIFSNIRKEYPNHRLIGEETPESHAPLDDSPTWIVDAIDGTTNFVHGIPHFAVCIAHARNKSVEVGVVYNPVTKEMFHAVNGKGAYVNGRKLKCSDNSSFQHSIILSEWGYVRGSGAKSILNVNERLLTAGVRGVRQLGSGALDICYVAMGVADGVYCGVEAQKRDSWHVWDYAAASIVAEEAGAMLRTVDGQPFHIEADSMVCAAPGILQELLNTIQQCNENGIDKLAVKQL